MEQDTIRLIGLSGKMTSGKDTVAGMIQDISYEIFETNIWQTKRFAGKLKEIVSILTGIRVDDLEKIEVKNSRLGKEWTHAFGKPIPPTVREMLQVVGTEAMRDKIHNDVWVNALFSEWSGRDTQNWIITDLRFPNEAKAIKERGGILIRVNRPGMEATGSHPSETSLDNYPYWNHVIENSGTLVDLYEKVENILQPLIYSRVK